MCSAPDDLIYAKLQVFTQLDLISNNLHMNFTASALQTLGQHKKTTKDLVGSLLSPSRNKLTFLIFAALAD